MVCTRNRSSTFKPTPTCQTFPHSGGRRGRGAHDTFAVRGGLSEVQLGERAAAKVAAGDAAGVRPQEDCLPLHGGEEEVGRAGKDSQGREEQGQGREE
jgi:hypothetical protein